MSNDASYIVRAEHGLLVVNINSRKVDAFFHPSELLGEKIKLYGEFNLSCEDACYLKIIDLLGNGDRGSFCNKGYGTTLVLSTLFVVDYHLAKSLISYNKSGYGLISRWLVFLEYEGCHINQEKIKAEYLNGIFIRHGTISVCDFKKALFDLSSHKNNTAKTKPI
ncbi:hypothetical protein [Aliivibrio wodanis]|uniref:hypothetical protein n=1 Tax=Aliivibrio wodanis TaxID=80852 RepID=UPI00406C4BEE